MPLEGHTFGSRVTLLVVGSHFSHLILDWVFWVNGKGESLVVPAEINVHLWGSTVRGGAVQPGDAVHSWGCSTVMGVQYSQASKHPPVGQAMR